MTTTKKSGAAGAFPLLLTLALLARPVFHWYYGCLCRYIGTYHAYREN